MLSKRWLINYLLIVLIIIFTWIGVKNPIREDQLINPNTITQLKPQQIDSIRVETADQTIQLQKQDARWHITQPLAWLADNVAAERLTTLASSEFSSSLEKDQVDLSTLGLRIPRAVVTLNQKSIYFGDVNRIGNRRYLLVDPMVYLVQDIHYGFISQGVAGLLDKRLLPPALELLSLNFPGFELQRQQAGWSAEPGDYPQKVIERLVRNWRQTQASTIRPLDKTLTPLNKIRAKLQDGGELEFYLQSIKPEIIIARPDLNLQYHFPERLYYELLSLQTPAQ